MKGRHIIGERFTSEKVEIPSREDIARAERIQMPLFLNKSFKSHSGLDLSFKIDCDALTADDWEAIASLIGPKLQFSAVDGVPRGGIPFAEALKPYASDDGGLLIVDDVLTTGGSMEEVRKAASGFKTVKGIVLFARGECPDWIEPVFTLNPRFG